MGRKQSVFEGSVFTTAQGYEVEVLEYRSSTNILVEFNDSMKTRIEVEKVQLKRGNLTNPHHPSVKGIGFIGQGPHLTRVDGNSMTKEYKHWFNMMDRCTKTSQKYVNYFKCFVDKQWYNYQEFAEWCNWQVGFSQDGWHLDKDLLCKDNRTYSPEFCVFLPQELNNFDNKRETLRGEYPIGVTLDKASSKFASQGNFKGFHKKHLGRYDTPIEAFLKYKEVKELHAKHLADKYSGVVDDRVIEALLRYEVSIND